MSLDWDSVTVFALGLPDTEMSTSYGSPAVKIVSNGRAFIHAGREADSFVLAIDQDTKEMLIETDPDTFWQTPHYHGWPGLLVRYDSNDPERIHAMIERARDWAAARPKVKPRPRAKPNRAKQ